MLNNWLVFSRKNQYEYNVHDCRYDEDYTMEVTIASFVRKLNGHRNPYSINSELTKTEMNIVLAQLSEYGLLRNRRTMDNTPGGVYYALWFIKRTPLLISLARLWNKTLLLLWVPVLIVGILCFARYMSISYSDYMWLGSGFGIVFGMLFHELGHAFAGVSYGARVFEVGVMIDGFLPGAYVLMNTQNVKSRLKRIQIDAAGIESNALLTGMLLIIACAIPSIGAFCIIAAIFNILSVLENFTFSRGLDGASILSEILGIEDLVDGTKKVVMNTKIRKKLRSKGASGHALIAVSFVVQLLQISVPVLIGWSVMESILWFL